MKQHRVIVSTDLGGDPDDIQSLFRLLHYSDILRLEGILSTTGPGSVNSADLIRHWVQRIDLDHLRSQGHPELMDEQTALSHIKQGSTTPGAPTPERRTDGSEWIIERAHATSGAEGITGSAGGGGGSGSAPLWVLCWGSMTDVAQALHDDPSIAGRIRIYAIGSTNTTHDPASRDFVSDGMASRWPELWWIENGVLPRLSRDTFRGVYLGGNQEGEWSNTAFVARNIRGRGTTHDGLFAERGGDAFPLARWPNGVLKEGDSPSFLYLLSPEIGGVGDVDDPIQESWGGQFYRPQPDRFPNYYTDLDADAETCQATINKWRVDFLRDWKHRWQWYAP